MIEDKVKSFFTSDNPAIKQYLAQHLNYFDDFTVMSEQKIFYGLKVDKVILDKNKKFLSLIECKGDVGTTEYVRGIGQILQYRTQAKKELRNRMAENFSIVLAFPNKLNTKQNPVEIEKLEYPNDAHLFIINSQNNSYKAINLAITKIGSKTKYFGEKLVSISPYYFRDNTFAEYFIGLHTMYYRGFYQKKVSRNIDDVLKVCGSHNPGNGRNVGITLSSLGFIDTNNRLTPDGHKFLELSYPKFVEKLTYDYAFPYINSVFSIINDNNDIKNKDHQRLLINKLWNLSDEQQIEFLTESDGKDKTKYIGSWNYVLKRSLKCLDFDPRKTNFKVKYNPTIGLPSIASKLKETEIPNEIKVFLSKLDNPSEFFQ